MKSVLFFLYVVLFSTTIHAKVEVLCLGEGECITLDNAVHPGSLSGASTDQKLGYLKWYQDQFNSSIVINKSIINDIEAGNGTQDDLKALNEYIEDINNKIDKDSDFGGGSSPSDEPSDDIVQACKDNPLDDPVVCEVIAPGEYADAVAVQECKNNPLDDPEVCEGLAPNEYKLARCKAEPLDDPEVCEGLAPNEYKLAKLARCKAEPQEGCPEFLREQVKKLHIDIVKTVDVGSVTELSSTGGSGKGEVIYSVEGKCTIEEGTNLKAPDEEGICIINANKGSDGDFKDADASPFEITVAAAEIADVDHQAGGCFRETWGSAEILRSQYGATTDTPTCNCEDINNSAGFSRNQGISGWTVRSAVEYCKKTNENNSLNILMNSNDPTDYKMNCQKSNHINNPELATFSWLKQLIGFVKTFRVDGYDNSVSILVDRGIIGVIPYRSYTEALVANDCISQGERDNFEEWIRLTKEVIFSKSIDRPRNVQKTRVSQEEWDDWLHLCGALLLNRGGRDGDDGECLTKIKLYMEN